MRQAGLYRGEIRLLAYTIRGGHEPAMSDITRSVAFCKAIRKRWATRPIYCSYHGQFTTPGAIRMGQALEPYNPLWYEEPIPPDNLLEFAEVARSVRIPLATGERLTTKTEFGMLLRAGGVKILQPALGRVGGIWRAKKIAAIAEIYNAEMAPHLYAGPVEWAANIHLSVAIPNLLICETIQTGWCLPHEADQELDHMGGWLYPATRRPRIGDRV